MGMIFPELPANRQRGSKPRCHLLTHGTRDDVAARLTSLISPWGTVRASDRWMPEGFDNCEEAQLHLATALLDQKKDRDAIRDWWLAAFRGKVQTPNFDLASTCVVDGQKGLLLVEAKAHDYELFQEEQGKRLAPDASVGSLRNHDHIGAAVSMANERLTRETGLPWSLSRDLRYQMSNRFASAWKLTAIEKPVILVYLGFIGCEDMRDGNRQRPIGSNEEWERLVFAHSARLFPNEVWNRKWTVEGKAFVPLIRTVGQELIRK